MNNRFHLDRPNAKVMGVCAGLSDWLGVDVLAIRLATIVALLVCGPVALLLYILAGWLAADGR